MMSKLMVLVVCLMLVSLPAAAQGEMAPTQLDRTAPFGAEAVVLTDTEMESITGGANPFVVGAAFGAASGVAGYLINTPSDEWTVGRAARRAASGAAAGVMAVVGGRFARW